MKTTVGGTNCSALDSKRMLSTLPDKPDHPALELEILELWEREGTFEQLREQNRGGPRFSFVDGPVTANKTGSASTPPGAAR